MNTPPEPTDDDALEIHREPSGLRVRGEIDAHSAPQLSEALHASSGDVALDMSDIEFVDSSGLRVLIECHQLLENRGDTLTIVDPAPAVVRMFELSVVDDYLNITRS